MPATYKGLGNNKPHMYDVVMYCTSYLQNDNLGHCKENIKLSVSTVPCF